MKRWLGVIVGSAATFFYLLTTCRSIWIGDSGEFALSLYSLGICHPPGYPLFTVLGRIFVWAMPFLRPIFAAGIFNVLLAGATVGVVYYIFRQRWDSLISVLLAILWAVNPVFWAETAGVEIYTLNMLLISLAFLVLLSHHRYRWYLAIYLFGLGLTNHPSALALAPLFIYLLIKEKKYKDLRMLVAGTVLLLICASLYFYLYLRSQNYPVSNWGSPDTLGRLLDHMLLKQYSGWVTYSFDNVIYSAGLFGRTVLKSWSWPGVLLAFTGLLGGWRHARDTTVGICLVLIFSLALSSSHQAINYEPFYIPMILFSQILISFNLYWFLRGRTLIGKSRLAVAVVTAIAVVVVGAVNFEENDKSSYEVYEKYARHLLDSAGDGYLFTAGDINSFGPLYLRYAEGYRPAIEAYDRSVRLHHLISRARSVRPLPRRDYLTVRDILIRSDHSVGNKSIAKNHYFYEPAWLAGVDLVDFHSCGLIYRSRPCLPHQSLEDFYKEPINELDPLTRQMLANIELCQGERYLDDADPDRDKAQMHFRRAIEFFDDDPRASLLNDIGIFFRQVGFHKLALETHGMALKKNVATKKLRRDITFNISNVYKDWGNEAMRQNNFPEAFRQYENALTYDPSNLVLLRNVSMIALVNLQDTTTGIKYLTEYIKLSPNDQKARFLLESLTGR